MWSSRRRLRRASEHWRAAELHSRRRVHVAKQVLAAAVVHVATFVEPPAQPLRALQRLIDGCGLWRRRHGRRPAAARAAAGGGGGAASRRGRRGGGLHRAARHGAAPRRSPRPCCTRSGGWKAWRRRPSRRRAGPRAGRCSPACGRGRRLPAAAPAGLRSARLSSHAPGAAVARATCCRSRWGSSRSRERPNRGRPGAPRLTWRKRRLRGALGGSGPAERRQRPRWRALPARRDDALARRAADGLEVSADGLGALRPQLGPRLFAVGTTAAVDPRRAGLAGWGYGATAASPSALQRRPALGAALPRWALPSLRGTGSSHSNSSSGSNSSSSRAAAAPAAATRARTSPRRTFIWWALGRRHLGTRGCGGWKAPQSRASRCAPPAFGCCGCAPPRSCRAVPAGAGTGPRGCGAIPPPP